ncbi:Hypothetical predicted protein [Olea europaea subsp. europaea]|uniref:Uncharacterized protein n=1 Tax=Olea europaea subsp. europaea TaxID=158383 RepID=A0A8S0P9Z6_OLEEU|nr:Hypothetical predicted protein [Olea europaea subsp. europaea]
MAGRKRSLSNDADMSALYKELDEVSCPICMEHPHNTVLLICSSHAKGCRSYICDTSYRHSNCLDRFTKLTGENTDSYTSLAPRSLHDFINASNRNFDVRTSSSLTGDHLDHDLNANNTGTAVEMPGGSGGSSTYDAVSDFAEQEGILWESFDLGENNMEKPEPRPNLRCPLCRGSVLGWKVVEEARMYLNQKSRTCSHESCLFSGNYGELRQHARMVHPTVCPADVDPSRQQAWQRLEEQRVNNDIVSAIRSSMPGAVVLGDYVIDNGDRLSGERERHVLSEYAFDNGSGLSGGSERVLGDYVYDNGSVLSGGTERSAEARRWLSTFFLFHMIGSTDPASEGRGVRSRGLARHRRPSGPFSRRHYLWGERLVHDDEEVEDDNNDEEEEDHNETDLNTLSDIGVDVHSNPRRRRRLMRSRSDQEQS